MKPIYIFAQEGVDIAPVSDGIFELLSIAGVETDVINSPWNFGSGPHESLDWYIEQSRNGDQLDAHVLRGLMGDAPWREHLDIHDLFIVSEDIGGQGLNYLVGLAEENVGALVSTARIGWMDEGTSYHCIKTAVMHEMGHVFGVPRYRPDLVDELGDHCNNTCIMRQGMTAPHDWIDMSQDRLDYGALCDECATDLVNFFM